MQKAVFMKFINVEIKAKCFHPEKVEAFLLNNNATFKGTDLQKDIYFNVPEGRLKLRQGNIENNLIFYKRNNFKLFEMYCVPHMVECYFVNTFIVIIVYDLPTAIPVKIACYFTGSLGIRNP